MSFAVFSLGDTPIAITQHDRLLEQARLRFKQADVQLKQARRVAAYTADDETMQALYEAECEYNAALQNYQSLNEVIPG